MPVEFLLSLTGAGLALAVLFWLAKREPDPDFKQILMVMLGLAVVNGGVSFALQPDVIRVCILVQIGLALAAFKACCQVSWPRALFSTVLLGALTVAIVFGVMFAKAGLSQAERAGAAHPSDRNTLAAVTTNSTTDKPVIATATARVDTIEEPTNAVAAVVVEPALEPSADWAGARRKLSVGGNVVRGKNRFVMINSVIYATGDSVSVCHDGSNYTWQVDWQTNRTVLVPLRVGPQPAPSPK